MIDSFLVQINKALKSVLVSAGERYGLLRLSPVLYNGLKDFVLRKGKRIRPYLFFLGYKGCCRPLACDETSLMKCCASIELLHAYMLIHDDVIDNSDLRRGKPTLHKIFDQKIKCANGAKIGHELAIVAGDILFALAMEAFLEIQEDKTRKENALRRLIATAAYTGMGEFIDIVYGHRPIESFSEKEIFLNYTLKTARYTFEGPLLLGATLAGAKTQELRKLSKLGIAAGQAFQIYDDFLDLFATADVIGKPVLSDLDESKKTLLVFKAFQKLYGQKKHAFRRILGKEKKSLDDLKQIRRFIVESGGYDASLKKMTALQKRAVQICHSLKMKPAYKKELLSVINKLSPQRMPIRL